MEALNEALRAARELYRAALSAFERCASDAIDVAARLVRVVEGVVVRDIGKITVSRADLESVDSPVEFRGIEELVFGDDVTPELFREKVARIVDVRRVVVPATIPLMHVALKCRRVGEIVRQVSR